MMIRSICLTALLVSTAAFTVTAQAEQVEARNPQSVVAALQEGGYKAVLAKDANEDPRIESASAGAKFIINFYGCADHKNCNSLTFFAGWTGLNVSMNQMNEWNKIRRFSRAYIDNDGDPILEFDIDLDDGGMSQELFINNVEYWDTSLASFKQHISAQ